MSLSSSHPPNHAIAWLASQHRRLADLRGEVIVIKVGGSIQDDPVRMRGVMRDVAALASLGARPVVIHGGGKAISAAMNAAGLKPRFVQGQRYTDEATLKIVEDVLVNQVNRELAGYLKEEGAKAAPLTSLGTCVLRAIKSGTDAAPGQPSEDLGLVGRVTTVDIKVILAAGEDGGVPLIAPVALAATGGQGKLNVNADVAAGTVAAALRPGLFVLVSDTPGVRTDPAREDTPPTYPQHLSREASKDLIARGVIAGGMLPKINACFEARDAGVPHVAIVDGRVAGALLGAAVGRDASPIAGTWIG